MAISTSMDRIHTQITHNRWLYYFYIFNRLVLAAGFIPSGMTKILGERFTSLSNNHPMGHYLEALFHTGYYYPFIGVMQVIAALLLLIPRTVTLGALLYFPIILNICILSFAVRFDGSLFTAPLMVLANLYLLYWNYDKLKYILPFKTGVHLQSLPKKKKYSNRFPWRFFSGVFLMVVLVVGAAITMYEVMPRNSLRDCAVQFKNTNRTTAGKAFCECIHNEGRSLDLCLEDYYQAEDDRALE